MSGLVHCRVERCPLAAPLSLLLPLLCVTQDMARTALREELLRSECMV